ncbi:hypothetical protein [Elizabethkingia bruuniana]|uniref:hypothetical protein n=1 Tax=Elizabethkingia bruuniana TaxID=1756149 RepID=UPI00099ABDA9|nr:hypothetical protein [Elizabethkingia bruuniana]OPC53468.1 hypothetical protein BAY07_15570 [Elizabethkingia bruuniana]
MKTLEQIKEEFAISQQFDTWKRLKYFYKDDQCAFENVLDDISQRYAREVAQASLQKAAEEANMKYHDGLIKLNTPKKYIQLGADNVQIDKESITNEYNIVML